MELESLDILIGIVTVYLTFALACTAIVEAISAWMSLRSTTLEKMLKEVFAGNLGEGKPFVTAFYEHPLIQSLSQDKNGRPSYIPPEIVGQTVLSLITSNDPSKSLASVIDNLPGTTDSNRIKGLLKALAVQTSEDITTLRKAVEVHFDAAMDRASGWAKRRSQLVTFIVSALLVLGANVDTVALTKQLSSNSQARERMLVAAEELLKRQENPTNEPPTKAGTKSDRPAESGVESSKGNAIPIPPKDKDISKVDEVDPSAKTLDIAKQKTAEANAALAKAEKLLDSTGLQFGWKPDDPANPKDPGGWCAKIVGLLVSAFAISLGAPFWFDLLQRVMRVRLAGIKPGEKKP